MRLEKIKLAGFKSFVDPTTVLLPSSRVGIVGPNGCGKSNVIDAVRWVMGESSAKMLRGESMADVIFNGSSARKPVGTASIELVFDNADGAAGGQYAQYNQISVRRQVSRDGQSVYFLNGVRCRRRDITDLFLGTGLGPRSYAIIEQGTISRLIEARPEELRVFLEEAAGISKYKERRRETENRIRHTRENLERLNDLREEVAKQLQHLKRQAATAERFRELKDEERQLQAELLALRWRGLDEAIKEQDKEIALREVEQQAVIARQRRMEAELEQDRTRHADISDRFNEIQGRYYALGAEVARLEQAIQYAGNRRQQQQRELEQLEVSLEETINLKQQDQAQLEELLTSLEREQPRLEQTREAEAASTEQLEHAEERMQQWQEEWDSFNQQAAEPAQRAQVERARINHLEQQSENLQRRSQRLEEELGRLDDPLLVEEIDRLEERERVDEAQTRLLQERFAGILERIRALREQITRHSDALDTDRAELQAATGRKASLEALQQAALGRQSNGELAEWLESHGLSQAARLAERMQVDERWRRAVEVVLGFRLQAVCVDRLDGLVGDVEGLSSGDLTLFESSSRAPTEAVAGSLLEFVDSPLPLKGLLDDVRCAETLDQALILRQGLSDKQSVITPDGLWLGRGWLRLNRGQNPASGVLAREQDLKQLAQCIRETEQKTRGLVERLEQDRTALQELEQSREEIQSDLDETNRRLSEIRSALSSKRTRAEHLAQRRDHVREERAEIGEQIKHGVEDLAQTRSSLHGALEEIDTLVGRRDALVEDRERLRERLRLAREENQQRSGQAHQIELKVQSLSSSRDSLRQGLERLEQQLKGLLHRQGELERELASARAPIEEQQQLLQQQLAARMAVEGELADARRSLEAIDNAMRQREQTRSQTEQEVQTERAAMDEARMRRQEVLVRAKTLEERLRETGYESASLFATLPDGAGEAEWQQRVEKIAARIQRLGAINLAAIDEFAEQSERMEYLDSQHADVNEALDTLEDAIRKIDRETRTRFKETFDKVNSGLQEKFPTLFGGGHAYLQLTGEDLLDTGVTVMARPPGKRNSSIHLLSGGEKALTAVALVFAIFELNAAPFCMLDEVDAPLDDANVGRFCQLVKAMSQQVQFIFITHNKVTMEMADHLTGVTMHEAGVSRLVSVDVDEAARMAAL